MGRQDEDAIQTTIDVNGILSWRTSIGGGELAPTTKVETKNTFLFIWINIYKKNLIGVLVQQIRGEKT